MAVGLLYKGKVTGVDPHFPTVVYADRSGVGAWEEGTLIARGNGKYSWIYNDANRVLTVEMDGTLTNRSVDAIGEYEELDLAADGVTLTRVNAILTLTAPFTAVPVPVPGVPPSGPLPSVHVEGQDLVDSNGHRHLIIGTTELLLAWRFDIYGADACRPVAEERMKLGFNNWRVLWQKDIDNANQPWMMPIEKIPAFLDFAAEYRTYVQGTILADCKPVDGGDVNRQRARVDAVRQVSAGYTNHFEQLGNEADKNDHDPTQFNRPTDRLAANSSSTEGGKDYPYWDYFCFSGQRSPVDHAIREYAPIEFLFGNGKGWGGVPALCDEGFKPGQQSSDPRDWYRAGCCARVCIGGRFHTQAGTLHKSVLFDDLERTCGFYFVQGMIGG